MLNIWGTEHGPWMQALHAVFGIGAWLGPLLASPFLKENKCDSETTSPTSDVIIQTTDSLNQSQLTTLQSVEESCFEESNIFYGYIIVGALCFTGFSVFFGLFLSGQRQICVKWSKEIQQETHDEELIPLEKKYVITMTIAVFVFYISYCILELNYGNFLSLYVIKHLHWTKLTGATITSVFWGSFTFGRLSGIIIIKHVPAQIILIIDVSMCLLSLIPMLFFTHPIIVWTCTVVFGFFMSTIFATGMSSKATFDESKKTTLISFICRHKICPVYVIESLDY